ncbi:MAG: hypothetical protein KJO80_16470 [Gammaproteobacteria bacterium]|nr:hypothetical protein [Gammaproteobacteria bacterium]
MSLFEFLMVLLSIIIGFGLAEILRGIARHVRNRDSASGYWVHAVLVCLVFVALLQQWWEIWGLRSYSGWSFLGLLMMLSGPIGLFLISYLLFPQPVKGANYREYYYGPMRPIWWIGVFTVTLATLFRPVVFGEELIKIGNTSSLISFVGFAVLALSKNRTVHAVLVPALFAAILWDILAMSFEIS